MRRERGPSPHTVVATLAVFLIVVAGNVLSEGMFRPPTVKLVAALAAIAAAAGYVVFRVRRFSAMDEMHQRLELEALAAAFAGSLLVFVAYWLLQAAGLLPPLNGVYYVIGMVGMANFGSRRAWQRLTGAPAAC